jgi:hypothetical protein
MAPLFLSANRNFSAGSYIYWMHQPSDRYLEPRGSQLARVGLILRAFVCPAGFFAK